MAGIGHTITKLNRQYSAHVSSAAIRIHCARITDYKWHVNLLLINVDVSLVLVAKVKNCWEEKQVCVAHSYTCS